MSIRVSVVVPTCRRPELLRRCLAALALQDFDPAEYEVIVVDDCASEVVRRTVEARDWWIERREPVPASAQRPVLGATLEGLPAWASTLGWPLASPAFASSYPWTNALHVAADANPTNAAPSLTRQPGIGEPVVRYVPVMGRHGPAAARNVGWRAAQGELIAFTDDDCIPAPGWLREGVHAFAEGVVGVSGRIIMPLDGTPTDYELNSTGLMSSEFVTANCFYRRLAIEEAGGFDESFTMAWREDSDLFFTMLGITARGGDMPWSALAVARYPRVPEAIVVHPVRPASWGISLRQQRRNIFNALLYKKHPELYRQRVQLSPPWLYYTIAAALIAALASLLGREPRVALAALALWAALTAQFAARRLRYTSHAPEHILEMLVTSALIPPLAVFWRLAGAIKYRVWFL